MTTNGGMMPLEFRVRWQRDGRQPTYRIFQSWDAACRKVRGLRALEDVKADFAQYDDMADLVAAPELQVREVGEWRRHDYQPKATEYDRVSMRDHAWWREPVSAPEDMEAAF
jgi:hypothetical protein